MYLENVCLQSERHIDDFRAGGWCRPVRKSKYDQVCKNRTCGHKIHLITLQVISGANYKETIFHN